jgi:hypothetical protein
MTKPPMRPAKPIGELARRTGVATSALRYRWRFTGGWTARIVGPMCDGDPVAVKFDAELWTWDARRADSWTFLSLPAEVTEDLAPQQRRGFGSRRVRVTVGGSTWTTSVFPDSARGCYVLPIKRAVREAEGLDSGDTATVTVEFIDQ